MTFQVVFSREQNFKFDPDLPKHQDWDFVYYNIVKNEIPLIKIQGLTYIDRSDTNSLSRKKLPERSFNWLVKLKHDLPESKYRYVEFCILCGYPKCVSINEFLIYGFSLLYKRKIKPLTFVKRLVQRFIYS